MVRHTCRYIQGKVMVYIVMCWCMLWYCERVFSPVCFDFFGYVGYDRLYMSRFTEDWVCYSKCIKVVVCCCMLSSILEILTLFYGCISSRVPCYFDSDLSIINLDVYPHW